MSLAMMGRKKIGCKSSFQIDKHNLITGQEYIIDINTFYYFMNSDIYKDKIVDLTPSFMSLAVTSALNRETPYAWE